VRVETTNGTFVTTIADDGIGMTPAQLEQLVRASYSSKPNGSGFGLPIARRIAAAHRGELHIASGPGTGTTVRVELPAADGHL
jgi:two-component system sensor histidine kinase HydH